ncbi:MAG: glycosyltransferase family 2 protein [Rhodocyclaceae bacterium]|nr:glycosyltransferase family 2 protein [Rhodocyclaceae bacterium]
MNATPATRTAVVIPVYNHGSTIAATVERLLPHGLPIFITDDGSNEATRAELERLARTCPLVDLQRLPQNRGKGAAVIDAMRRAHARGHTHALQIDADGQHDIGDLPRFLAASAEQPAALVTGKPVYDASAPSSRRYGRLIALFWVRLETLSPDIGDAMCGYRIYPLAPSVRLADRVAIAPRMPFDIDIMVRLSWMGVPIVNLPTRVIYPPGGLSHFRMLRDNLQISLTHTRLCAGMLLRLPVLLWRKLRPRDAARAHWSDLGERGTRLGLHTIVAIYRLLGDRVARLALRPIVAWHFLTGARARRASLDYLRRLAGRRAGMPEPGYANAYRHMLAFAESALDKLAGWSGRLPAPAIDFPARAEFDALLASGRGAVLVGGHLGNLEMLRAIASRDKVARITAVVYSEHARRFAAALAAVNEQYGVNLLHVPDFGPDTAIALRERVDRGELLVIVGDRTPPAQTGRTVQADFLGAPAAFPQGPYILAWLLECPVYLLFCLRGAGGYRICFEHFAERIELPRARRDAALREYAQRYANRLEALCLEAPLQWFNFFDFWRRPPETAARPATVPTPDHYRSQP